MSSTRHRIRSIPTLLPSSTSTSALAPSPLPPSLPLIQTRTYAIASGQSSSSSSSSAARDAQNSTSADSKLDIIRRTLYPPTPTTSLAPNAPTGSSLQSTLLDSTRRNPSTPTGSYSSNLVPKLRYVLGEKKEIHETIMRAWEGYQDRQEKLRELDLRKKFASMQRACERLRMLSTSSSSSSLLSSSIDSSSPSDQSQEEDHNNPTNKYLRNLYNSAMYTPNMRKTPSSLSPSSPSSSSSTTGPSRKMSMIEKKWRASRIEGLFPRELEVPRESWKSGERWSYGWKKVV